MPHAEEPFAHSGVVDDEMLLGMVKLLPPYPYSYPYSYPYP